MLSMLQAYYQAQIAQDPKTAYSLDDKSYAKEFSSVILLGSVFDLQVATFFEENHLSIVCNIVGAEGDLTPFKNSTIFSHALTCFLKNEGILIEALIDETDDAFRDVCVQYGTDII